MALFTFMDLIVRVSEDLRRIAVYGTTWSEVTLKVTPSPPRLFKRQSLSDNSPPLTQTIRFHHGMSNPAVSNPGIKIQNSIKHNALWNGKSEQSQFKPWLIQGQLNIEGITHLR